MIIDHVGIPVADLERSVAFYEKALAPLGISLVMKFPGGAGFGANGQPELWLSPGGGGQTLHVALRAKGRADVRKFYEAAIAAGATDNGAPGVRAQYHENYYGAFVRDPDGHNIEAVCHEPYLG